MQVRLLESTHTTLVSIAHGNEKLFQKVLSKKEQDKRPFAFKKIHMGRFFCLNYFLFLRRRYVALSVLIWILMEYHISCPIYNILPLTLYTVDLGKKGEEATPVGINSKSDTNQNHGFKNANITCLDILRSLTMPITKLRADQAVVN